VSSADDLLADLASIEAAPPAVRRTVPPPQELSMMDQLLAKVPTGLVNNPAVAGTRLLANKIAEPMVGGAQAIANLFPDSTGVPKLYNDKVAEMLRQDHAASKEVGPVAAGANELVGGAASPMNLALALRAAPAVTAGQRAIQGAGIGAVGGATAPVEVGESEKFWQPKAAQVATGAGTGAVLAPVFGAVADRVTARMNAKGMTPGAAAKEADDIISSALKDSNQRLEDIPPDTLQQLRGQVTQSLAKGQKLDAAAAMRMKDFQAEKITPTLGWVTRDPMQWAEEQNVRGVKGAGEKVGALISEGNRAVTQGVGQYGVNAAEPAAASQSIAAALRNYDATKQGNVGTAYATARASAGKDLEIPTAGLTDAYKQVFADFEDKVPKAIQTKFKALEKGPLTFEAADKLRKSINEHVLPDPKDPTNKALGILRDALNNAQEQSAASGGPFAPAVKLASQRFAEHREIPALADAANGAVDDNFVRRNIIANPSTPEVKRLAALLREQSPESFQEARQQIGAHLAEKAFGANAAGDKGVNQETYNRALKTLGTGKLEAFFEPQEVEQLKRLGRLASYQVSPPAGSAANYSNTASTIANLLRSAGGFLPVGKGTVQFAGDKIAAGNAMRPEVPVTPNLSDAQRKALSRALLAVTGGGAMTVPRIVGEQP
jgi:hypothetical protein